MDFFIPVIGGLLLVLYSWTFYNLPALLLGLRRTIGKRNNLTGPVTPLDSEGLPTFSIVVAAKNEERVIARLLDRLKRLNYPKHRYEVVVVEDGSTDGTPDICERIARENSEFMHFFHRPSSEGKPAALNFALGKCEGEIIGVLDADNLPDFDILRLAAAYFQDSSLAAIQGMTLPINPEQNVVTKLGAYEEAAWFKIYLLGKEQLGLFIPMTGSCGFVRRSVAQELGGWDETSLAEDVELAARMVKKGHRIRYAPEVQSRQEYPASVQTLVRQRTRWFRGYMETWARYGSLMRSPSKIKLDAEVTLFGPYILNLILLSNLVALSGIVYSGLMLPTWLTVLATSATLLTLGTMFVCGLALAWNLRPLRFRNLTWIPAVYAFWFVQTIIAFRALILTLARSDRTWVKTEKSGNRSEHVV